MPFWHLFRREGFTFSFPPFKNPEKMRKPPEHVRKAIIMMLNNDILRDPFNIDEITSCCASLEWNGVGRWIHYHRASYLKWAEKNFQ